MINWKLDVTELVNLKYMTKDLVKNYETWTLRIDAITYGFKRRLTL